MDIFDKINQKVELTNIPCRPFGKIMKNNSFHELVESIVDKLNLSTTLFTVDAYRLDNVKNEDRESELKKLLYKTVSSKNEATFNINKKGIYYKLTLLIRVNESRINNQNEYETNRLKRNNDTHLFNLLKYSDEDWVPKCDMSTLDLSSPEPSLNTFFTTSIWVPLTYNGMMSVDSNMFYIYLSQDTKVEVVNDMKIKINRYPSLPAPNTDEFKQFYKNRLLYYYITIMDQSQGKYFKPEFEGVVTFSSSGTKNVCNVYAVIKKFNIQIDAEVESHPLMVESKKQFEASDGVVGGHIEEIDKSTINQALRILLRIEEFKWKFRRFGGIVDGVEIRMKNYISKALRPIVRSGMSPSKELIFDGYMNQEMADEISKIGEDIPHDLFTKTIREHDVDSVVSNYSSDITFSSLKTAKSVTIGNKVETIFEKQDMDLLDPWGVSQTKNIMKINAVSPFLSDDMVGD